MAEHLAINELLDLNFNNEQSLYEQLYKELVKRIVTGRIRTGTQLPASRNLAQQLGFSRNTVIRAYDQLLAEGYIKSKKGAGVFVEANIPDHFCNTKPLPDGTTEAVRQTDNKCKPCLMPGIPDLEHFPHKKWASLCNKAIREQQKSLYYTTEKDGYLPLKHAIADYLRHARNVHCEAEQIIITTGAQEAINLILTTMLKRNDFIAVENPGYTGVYNALNGYKVKPIPVLNDGISLKKLDALKTKPKLIYVTPTHQYPMSATLPISKRLALLEYAKKHKNYLIEDDYDSEYHYQVKPLPAMQSFDVDERVIYLGSFSKVIFPSLRIGYIVAPKHLADKFKHIKQTVFGQTAMLYQMVLTEFMRSGDFGRHIKRMRLLYSKKHIVMLNACKRHLANYVDIHAQSVGLHVTLTFKDKSFDDVNFTTILAKQKIDVMPLSHYCYGNKKLTGLVIGFGNAELDSIEQDIQKLKRILNTVSKSPTGSRSAKF